MQIVDKIKKCQAELISLRRDFHQHPELGFNEHRTARVVETYLQKLGLATKRVAGTGVVALLEGSEPGPTLMLRADMDALPVQEENDLDYASATPGIMHACGHDAHMAMLLVAAKILVKIKSQLKGTIKFVFQPNEEVAGAIHMISEGVLENPRVDAGVGIHVWPTIETGKIGISSGVVMAGLDVFKMTINGQGGHTGQPEDAVDPILAAANFIQTVQMIQTREISDLKPTIIMFGKIEGGTKSNIVSDKVYLEGSIRFLYKGGPDSNEQPTERFIRIAEQVCRTHRCTCDIEIEHENIPLVNDDKMVEIAKATAAEVFYSKEAIVDNISIASEDFSEFSERVPSVFLFLGAGNREKKINLPLHNPRFKIDEDALTDGVAMFVFSVINYFKQDM